MTSRRKVRVGVVGVGNCASSLVQGLTYYRDAGGNEPIPGLMHADLGGYRVGDVEIASAFDVNADKRKSCLFASGSKTTETIGPMVPHGDALPFKHVIVLMLENRSFDHYFDQPRADGTRPWAHVARATAHPALPIVESFTRWMKESRLEAAAP